MATTYFEYAFNQTLTPPPAAGGLRFNAAAPYDGVTEAYLSTSTTNNVDVYHALTRLAPGSLLEELEWAGVSTEASATELGRRYAVPGPAQVGT